MVRLERMLSVAVAVVAVLYLSPVYIRPSQAPPPLPLGKRLLSSLSSAVSTHILGLDNAAQIDPEDGAAVRRFRRTLDTVLGLEALKWPAVPQDEVHVAEMVLGGVRVLVHRPSAARAAAADGEGRGGRKASHVENGAGIAPPETAERPLTGTTATD